MFEAQFKNDLKFKKIDYIDCVQDFENHEELKNWIKRDPSLNHLKELKVFLLRKEDFEIPKKSFKTIHVVDGKLWFDFEDQYLVCEELKQETVDYFLKGNRKFVMASVQSKTKAVELIAEYLLPELKEIK